MTEKWRPPNWKNPYSDDKVRIHNLSTLIDEMQTGLHLDHQYRKDMERVFEAGADAMLRELWQLAQESPTKTFTIDANFYQVFSGGEK